MEQLENLFGALHVDMPSAICNRFASHVLQAMVTRSMAFPEPLADPSATEPAVGEGSDDPDAPAPHLTLGRAFFKLSETLQVPSCIFYSFDGREGRLVES